MRRFVAFVLLLITSAAIGMSSTAAQTVAIMDAASQQREPHQQPWGNLPAVLIAFVCHFLPLRALVLYAATSSRHRHVICRDAVADCWSFAPAARIRWGVGVTTQWVMGCDSLAPTLQLNGQVLSSLTKAIAHELVSALPTPEVQLSRADAEPALCESDDSAHAPQPNLVGRLRQPLASRLPLSTLLSLWNFLCSLQYVRRVEFEQWEPSRHPSFNVLFTVLAILPTFSRLQHLALNVPSLHYTSQMQPGREQESEPTRLLLRAIDSALLGCLHNLKAVQFLGSDRTRRPVRRCYPGQHCAQLSVRRPPAACCAARPGAEAMDASSRRTVGCSTPHGRAQSTDGIRPHTWAGAAGIPIPAITSRGLGVRAYHVQRAPYLP